MQYELTKAITTASGANVTALELDFESLSLADIKNARKVKAYLGDEKVGEVSTGTLSPRLDVNLRIGLSWIAAMKTNKELSIMDVLTISAKDALALADCGLEYLF